MINLSVTGILNNTLTCQRKQSPIPLESHNKTVLLEKQDIRNINSSTC